MAQKPIIRKLLAGVLLLVFTFSIAPKKFLHDAIANHKDKVLVVATGDSQQLSHAGFVCKCDNLVAESPFTDEITHFELSVRRFFAIQQSAHLYHFHTPAVYFFQRRGPPVAACLQG